MKPFNRQHSYLPEHRLRRTVWRAGIAPVSYPVENCSFDDISSNERNRHIGLKEKRSEVEKIDSPELESVKRPLKRLRESNNSFNEPAEHHPAPSPRSNNQVVSIRKEENEHSDQENVDLSYAPYFMYPPPNVPDELPFKITTRRKDTAYNMDDARHMAGQDRGIFSKPRMRDAQNQTMVLVPSPTEKGAYVRKGSTFGLTSEEMDEMNGIRKEFRNTGVQTEDFTKSNEHVAIQTESILLTDAATLSHSIDTQTDEAEEEEEETVKINIEDIPPVPEETLEEREEVLQVLIQSMKKSGRAHEIPKLLMEEQARKEVLWAKKMGIEPEENEYHEEPPKGLLGVPLANPLFARQDQSTINDSTSTFENIASQTLNDQQNPSIDAITNIFIFCK